MNRRSYHDRRLHPELANFGRSTGGAVTDGGEALGTELGEVLVGSSSGQIPGTALEAATIVMGYFSNLTAAQRAEEVGNIERTRVHLGLTVTNTPG